VIPPLPELPFWEYLSESISMLQHYPAIYLFWIQVNFDNPGTLVLCRFLLLLILLETKFIEKGNRF